MNLSDCVNPSDRFLSEVAAFVETDRSGIAINFLRKVFRADISAKHGGTGSNTQKIKYGNVAFARFFRQCLGKRICRLRFNLKQESREAENVSPTTTQLDTLPGGLREAKISGADFQAEYFLADRFGLWTAKGPLLPLATVVHALNVFPDLISIEMG